MYEVSGTSRQLTKYLLDNGPRYSLRTDLLLPLGQTPFLCPGWQIQVLCIDANLPCFRLTLIVRFFLVSHTYKVGFHSQV